ncbi:MAG: LD-carboxypeptidase [Pseudomonadota bacterium]
MRVPLPCGERRLGLCAPASHFKREDFEAGVKILEARGFRPKFSERVFQRKGFFAGDERSRAEELHGLFTDPEVGAIMAVRGGWGSLRLLEYLDFDLIRRHPKLLVGFSDITALLAALNERAGVVALHGPTVASLPRLAADSIDALTVALKTGAVAGVRPASGHVAHPPRASVSGRLVGGNLSTLVSLLGTPYAPKNTTGGLLLLEDVREKPYRLDRMLCSLRLSGLLDGVNAVLLGDFTACGHPALAVVLAALKDLRVPVVTGYAFGHGERNTVLPLGAEAVLERDGLLRFERSESDI